MSGSDRKKAIKVNSKVRMFCLFLAVVFVLSQAINVSAVNATKKVYVDRVVGINTNSGKSPNNAVKSIRKARELLKGEGTIYVKVDGEWVELSTKGKAEAKSEKASSTDKKEAEVEEAQTLVGEGLDPTANIDKTEEIADTPKTEEAPKSEEAPALAGEDLDPTAKTDEAKEIANTSDNDEAETKSEDTTTKEDTTNKDTTDKDTAEDDVITDDVVKDTTTEDVSEVETEEIADAPSDDEAPTEDQDAILEEDKVEVDDLTRTVRQMTFMLERESDIADVEAASKAYEALDDEAKSEVPDDVYKRLRTAQVVADNAGMRNVSTPVEIVGNTEAVYGNAGGQGSSSNSSNSSSSSSSSSTRSTNNENSTTTRASVTGTSVGAKTADVNKVLETAAIGAIAGAVVGGLIGLVFLKQKKKKRP